MSTASHPTPSLAQALPGVVWPAYTPHTCLTTEGLVGNPDSRRLPEAPLAGPHWDGEGQAGLRGRG